MDFDFLGDIANVGSHGGRWKSRTAILFAVLGAGLGGYLGYLAGGFSGAAGGALAGAFLGWFLVMLLAGLAIILVPVAILGLAYVGWLWLTGALS